MPGFMGLRGLELKDAREIELHRRGEHRKAGGEKRDTERMERIIQKQTQVISAPPKTARDSDRFNPARRTGSLSEVGDIMSGRVAVLTFDDSILVAHEIFARVKIHHLPIIDEQGGIIGVISDRDVLKNSSPFFGTINEQKRDVEIMNRKVGLIMSRNPLCVNPDIPVVEAIKLMNGKHISCLPIVDVDGRKLLGILTWKDVVRALCPEGFDSSHDSGRLRIINTLDTLERGAEKDGASSPEKIPESPPG
ncbi:MAG: CBS domain-containing protein [Planctomycetota bacterium]|jgi:acetoin utilization protein AcuB|nr:CBS domain-containing protein [Planctomycetota bacterium]